MLTARNSVEGDTEIIVYSVHCAIKCIVSKNKLNRNANLVVDAEDLICGCINSVCLGIRHVHDGSVHQTLGDGGEELLPTHRTKINTKNCIPLSCIESPWYMH